MGNKQFTPNTENEDQLLLFNLIQTKSTDNELNEFLNTLETNYKLFDFDIKNNKDNRRCHFLTHVLYNYTNGNYFNILIESKHMNINLVPKMLSRDYMNNNSNAAHIITKYKYTKNFLGRTRERNKNYNNFLKLNSYIIHNDISKLEHLYYQEDMLVDISESGLPLEIINHFRFIPESFLEINSLDTIDKIYDKGLFTKNMFSRTYLFHLICVNRPQYIEELFKKRLISKETLKRGYIIGALYMDETRYSTKNPYQLLAEFNPEYISKLNEYIEKYGLVDDEDIPIRMKKRVNYQYT